MGKIVFTDMAEGVSEGLPQVAGRSVSGGARTTGVLTGEDRPIWLWRFDLQHGAKVAFDAPAAGHAIYLARGSAVVDGTAIKAGGAVLVEHGGGVSIEAVGDDVILLDFHERDAGGAAGAGGGVHIVPEARPVGGQGGMQYTLFADAMCPTCSLWLHHVEYCDPYRGTRHLHTEDEVIVVVGGTIHVGMRPLKPGAVIAIDEGMLYSFNVGEDGGAFINFRPADPGYVKVDKEGRAPMLREREILAAMPRVADGPWRVPAPVLI